MIDFLIIGAGVIGCSVARELSFFDTSVTVLEQNLDVGAGASGANSGIVHAGYDCTPGSLMAKFNVMGSQMYEQWASELDIEYRKTGSLVVATNDEEVERLHELQEKGALNGVTTTILPREELVKLAPNVSQDVLFALYAPSAAIVNPFEATVANYENAVANGVKFVFNSAVSSVKVSADSIEVSCGDKVYTARTVINCAGVNSGRIAQLCGDNSIDIQPRVGEYILTDKTYVVDMPIFQAPTRMGKGILVAPTTSGNLFIGPTSINIEDGNDNFVRYDSLNSLRRINTVAGLPLNQTITNFAGVRAVEKRGDFVIGWSEQVAAVISSLNESVSDSDSSAPFTAKGAKAENSANQSLSADLAANAHAAQNLCGLYNVAGICSPGLSSAPAIAKFVAESFRLPHKKVINRNRRAITRFNHCSLQEKNNLIKSNSAYGNVVCRCETVTEAEVVDAIKRGATTVDGVKRRTRCGMGRCQGGFCMPTIMKILARELNVNLSDIVKDSPNSWIVKPI